MAENIRMNTRTSILIGLLIVLVGCASQPPVQEPARQIDLAETEKLATEYYEKGNWLESEKHYTILAENTPQASLIWLRLGNIYMMTNRYEAALLAYREAVTRDRTLANAWYNLGVLQLRQAAHSFNEMQIHVSPTDPLTEKSQGLLEGIMELIQGSLD